MVNRKCIAIIPARGGSKRIPKKNILDFHGKPMIAYTIEAALKTGLFSRVMVSTDSKEIANISKEYGASVPFLRNNHTDDFSNVSDVVVHTLKRVTIELEENYDVVAMLMPNCPLRNSKDILKLFNDFRENEAIFQISAFKYGWMNPWWAHTVDSNNIARPVFNNTIKSRSQDLDELYCPTGALWIASVPEILKSGTFYGENFHFGILNWKSAIDIDDYDDLEMAKVLFSTII